MDALIIYGWSLPGKFSHSSTFTSVLSSVSAASPLKLFCKQAFGIVKLEPYAVSWGRKVIGHEGWTTPLIYERDGGAYVVSVWIWYGLKLTEFWCDRACCSAVVWTFHSCEIVVLLPALLNRYPGLRWWLLNSWIRVRVASKQEIWPEFAIGWNKVVSRFWETITEGWDLELLPLEDEALFALPFLLLPPIGICLNLPPTVQCRLQVLQWCRGCVGLLLLK